jgi:arsenite-transporting ATPase
MRIILMCGKGGVGKSTLGAALAVRAAHSGARTLLFSVDPAHSLAPILGTPVGPQMAQVADRLWATELEAVGGLTDRWADAKGYAETLLRSQGLDQPLGAELAMLPGVEEVAALVQLKTYVDSGQFDAIILDNAPTAFALRLLALPEIAAWYAKHATRLYERYGAQLLMLLPMLGGTFPAPPQGLIGRSLGSAGTLQDLPRLLTDPETTSAKIATTPDPMGLAEARELYKWLSVYGLTVDELLMNQVLPAAVADPFFTGQKQREAAIMAEAREAFAGLPVREIPRHPEPLAGLDALGALGAQLWPEGDPLARRSTDVAIRIEPVDGEVRVAIKLPFVEPKAVDLAKYENELYITIGQHRRNLLLPAETADMQPVKARFSDGKLLVTLART